jgi:hypothetical protein
MLAFNKPQLPGQFGDQAAMSQLLMMLGGLGGPLKNPLAPSGIVGPQPGPPTDVNSNIIGGLGAR